MKKTVMMILFAFTVVFAISCDGKEDVKPVDEFAEIKAKLTGEWVLNYVQTTDGKTWTRDWICTNDVPEQYLGWVNDFTFTYVDGVFTRYVCDNDISITLTFLDNTTFRATISNNVYQDFNIISTTPNQIKLRLINNAGSTEDNLQEFIILNKEE